MGFSATEEGLALGEQLVPGEALAEQAYRRLRDAILAGELPAGSRLSVPQVARRLGISRSPAREAIARIAYEGLATYEPRRGAIVARVEPRDLVEIYELREVLEGLACRLAATRMSDSTLEELGEIVRRHQHVVDAGDIASHMELDQSFHQMIRRATNNGRLIESLDRLQGQIRIAMGTTRNSAGGMTQALTEHRKILAALDSRDPEGAERAAWDHVVRLRASLSPRGPADDADGAAHDARA